MLGPVNITLPANSSINRDRSQNIPGFAPAGSYSFNGYIGIHPDTVWDSDAFPFSKQGIRNWGLGISDWSGGGDSFDSQQTGSILYPLVFSLSVHPNPFNAATVLGFKLQASGFVHLAVFDLSGRLVAILVNGWREAGPHEVTFEGSGWPSGVYIYRIQTGEQCASGKMMLLK